MHGEKTSKTINKFLLIYCFGFCIERKRIDRHLQTWLLRKIFLISGDNFGFWKAYRLCRGREKEGERERAGQENGMFTIYKPSVKLWVAD